MVKFVPKQLAEGFAIESEATDKAQWDVIIRDLADASIYQTWAYERGRSGPGASAHVLLKNRGVVVAAAQARLALLPLFGRGLAYVRWGPLWGLRNGVVGDEVFRQAVRALRNEMVTKRRLALRLLPNLRAGEHDRLGGVLTEEGFTRRPAGRRFRTIVMDIRPSLEDLQRGFHQKWRNALNGARKQKLELIEGDGQELFEAFQVVYSQMQARKKFVSYSKLEDFCQMQRELPSEERMRIVLGKHEGEVCAGAICSALGSTGLYLFGATNERGMKTNASYLLQWRLLEWLKVQGCGFYDLNGINPEKNEGTYRFKSRLAGAHGREVQLLGEFEAYPGRTLQWLVTIAQFARDKMRRG